MSQVYRIDVNGYRVKQCKDGADVPCIRVDNGKTKWYAHKVQILGASEIIQNTFDPEQPNTPFIWIETDGPIEWE